MVPKSYPVCLRSCSLLSGHLAALLGSPALIRRLADDLDSFFSAAVSSSSLAICLFAASSAHSGHVLAILLRSSTSTHSIRFILAILHCWLMYVRSFPACGLWACAYYVLRSSMSRQPGANKIPGDGPKIEKLSILSPQY